MLRLTSVSSLPWTRTSVRGTMDRFEFEADRMGRRAVAGLIWDAEGVGGTTIRTERIARSITHEDWAGCIGYPELATHAIQQTPPTSLARTEDASNCLCHHRLVCALHHLSTPLALVSLRSGGASSSHLSNVPRPPPPPRHVGTSLDPTLPIFATFAPGRDGCSCSPL